MRQETLDFGEGSVEVTIIDNIIYMKALRSYTDDIALKMIHYLDAVIDQIPGPTIRIWDSRTIHPNNFHLTSLVCKKNHTGMRPPYRISNFRFEYHFQHP